MASRKEREAEELRRRRQARRRFKTLVRLVLYNRTWLLDTEEQQQLTSNVKKNIAMVIRPPRKFGLLTMTDKSLLRTHHFLRSIKDRKHLVTLIAHLTCFATFPPRVRARLVPVMTFLDLQKNRTILREGAEPQMVYFIIYGEVEIYQNKFDGMTQTYEPKLLGMLGTGDCIGEMEFIEKRNSRRTTAITASDTELLVIQSEEFEQILQPLMTQQWDERKAALKALQYFDFFTDEQFVAACKLSHLRQFESLETIYHEDKGLASYVYFVVSGECMILQCLKIKVKHIDGNKVYELINVEGDDDSNIFDNMSEKEIMKKMLQEKKVLDSSESTINEYENEADAAAAKPAQRPININIEALCAAKAPRAKAMPDEPLLLEDELSHKSKSDSDLLNQMLHEEGAKNFDSQSFTNDSSIESGDSTFMKRNEERLGQDTQTVEKVFKKSSLQVRKSKESQASRITFKDGTRQRSVGSHDSIDAKSRNLSAYSSENQSTKSVTIDSDAIDDNVESTENHFIDVGAMTFGGIFGLGEKIEHRVIMARTTVQCLMIPRFWLLEKEQNPGNIWQRRRFYLDCTIPSRQNLFKNFLATLKWQKFKTGLIQNTVRGTQKTNPTKVEDVPIMCRITEDR